MDPIAAPAPGIAPINVPSKLHLNQVGNNLFINENLKPSSLILKKLSFFFAISFLESIKSLKASGHANNPITITTNGIPSIKYA